MPLVKETVKLQLKAMFAEMSQYSEEDAQDKAADKLAEIIVNTIKTATVNPGIPVATSAGAGATSGPGTLS